MPVVSDFAPNVFGIPESEPRFGLELEVENVVLPDDVDDSLWATVSDGSLRGAGVEFLSSRPFTRDEVTAQVQLFYGWLNEHRYTTGVRTSTHVHANVLGMTEAQVAAVCHVYTLLEPLLYRYCGPLREENIYCVPWYRARDELTYVGQLMRGRWTGLHSSCKYSGLYLEPIVRFGTLEFRQAPVFDTAEELLTWVDMVDRIVYSGFDSPQEVMDAWRELSVDEFVEGIFGSRLFRVLQGYVISDFEELLDSYDVETTAELSRCTYNENGEVTDWFTPAYRVQGTGHVGYHRERRTYDPPPSFYDDMDEYPDEDEYHEEDY
jgi:hypothetical protein